MAYDRFYPHLRQDIKVQAFDVLDYYSANRHQFDGMHFTAQFTKLFDECKPFMGLGDEDLARAVDIVLTLEQRRMNSYSQGNTHIEDYVPANVKDWREYLK
jgi:hypothetical protein